MGVGQMGAWQFNSENDFFVLPGLEEIVEDRIFEEYQHKDEIYEFSIIINSFNTFTYNYIIFINFWKV